MPVKDGGGQSNSGKNSEESRTHRKMNENQNRVHANQGRTNQDNGAGLAPFTLKDIDRPQSTAVACVCVCEFDQF